LSGPFFFQAAAGIRAFHVTGVQTCALPICAAAGIERHSDRPAAGVAVAVEEAGDEILRLVASRPAAGKRYPDHLVACQIVPVPTAVHAHERAVRVSGREALGADESQPQRGDVRAERIIGLDRRPDQLRLLGADAWIDVLAPIAVRPTIEAAVANRGYVVRNELRTDLVALVDRRPQRVGFGVNRQRGGIANARSVSAMRAGLTVYFP